MQFQLREAPCHVGVHVTLDAWAAADDDRQIRVRQRACVDREITIGLRPSLAMQSEHRAFDSRDGHLWSHVGANTPICRQRRPTLDQVVCRFACGLERTLLAEILIVGQQPPNHIPQFMHIPEALNPLLGNHDADIAVGFLSLDRLLHEMLLQGQHSRIVRISGKFHRGINQLAETDVATFAGLVPERRQEIAIGIQHEQVVRNRHIDSSADLAANLHLSQPERREVVSRRQAPVEATRNCQQREQAGGNAGSNRAQEVTT